MNDVIELNPQDTIEDQASIWIARLDRGLSPEETQAFQQWVTEKREHYDTFMALAEFWDMTEQFNSLPLDTLEKHLSAAAGDTQAATSSSASSQTNNVKPIGAKRKRTVLSFAIAASLIFVFSALLFKGILNLGDPALSYSASLIAKTEVITEKLPDGSTLVLNAGTAAEIAFTGESRNILLKSGEIFIEVASDKTRPLTVSAKGRFFRAVGTAFLVSMEDEEKIEMLVTEGKVAYGVENKKTKANTDAPIAKAGQQVLSIADRFEVEEVALSELDHHLSWRKGIFVFTEKSLEEIVKQVTKYSDKKIIIANPKLAQEKITVRFEVKNIKEFLQTLEETLGLTWRENDYAIFIEE